MRMHQGSAPSSCAASSSSSSSSTFCSRSSRVPRSSALLPISSSPTSAHYVTLLSTGHICPRDTRESPRRFRHAAPGPLLKGDQIGGANERIRGTKERKETGDERMKGWEARGSKETIYCPAIRGSRRGPHSVCFQQRTSIVRLPVAERSPRARDAPTLAAAPTDAGLLQSVELSGELIFQRYQRQRRYLVASTAATPVDDDDEDDDGAIAVVRGSPRNLGHLAYPLLRRRPSRFLFAITPPYNLLLLLSCWMARCLIIYIFITVSRATNTRHRTFLSPPSQTCLFLSNVICFLPFQIFKNTLQSGKMEENGRKGRNIKTEAS